MGLLQGGNEKQGKARNGPRRDGVAGMLGPLDHNGPWKREHEEFPQSLPGAGCRPGAREIDAGSTGKRHHTEKALDGVPCGLGGEGAGGGGDSEPTGRACTILCVFSWARMHGSRSTLRLRATQAYEPRHSDNQGFGLGYA